MRNTQYLHRRGGRWHCCIRWPTEVWESLGNGSFKKALLTGSRDAALRLLPGAEQEFLAAVAAAKGQMEGKPRPLGTGEIQLIVSRWFSEAQRSFVISTKPRPYDAEADRSEEALMASLEQWILGQNKRLGKGDYSTLHPIVERLLARAGINADRDDPSFGLLCRTLMRAWMAIEERTVAQMRGEFGFEPADLILTELATEEPTSRAPNLKTVEDLITQFSAEKAAKWSPSAVRA